MASPPAERLMGGELPWLLSVKVGVTWATGSGEELTKLPRLCGKPNPSEVFGGPPAKVYVGKTLPLLHVSLSISVLVLHK